jgi:hypothetical protein
MKTITKLTLSLIFLSTFLLACLIVLTIGFTGLWLRTYRVFSQKTLIAEVEISEQQSDENGDFAIVTYRPIKSESALARVFFEDSKENEYLKEMEFKIYGDTIHIGGPIVKFKDKLIFFDFKTIYKVAKIFGRYNLDNNQEINKNETQAKFSSFDINGGVDSIWKDFSEQLNGDTLKSKLYNLVIETTQFSVPGQFVQDTPQKYNFYITNTGFLWDAK